MSGMNEEGWNSRVKEEPVAVVTQGGAGPDGNEVGDMVGGSSVLNMDTFTPAFAAVVAAFLADQNALRARLARIGQEESQDPV